MSRGKIKWFNATKVLGFIRQEDGGEDVFVHAKSVSGLGYGEGLKDGELVEYEVKRTPKGLQALNVRRLEGAQF